MENCIVTQSRLLIKQWSFGFIESSPLTRSKIHEKLFWFHTRVIFSAPRRSIILLVNYDSCWQHQMSVRALRHDRPSGRFSKSRGLSASVSFLSSPPPPRSFTCAIFRAVFDSRSSFFAPKPHGNACYAGYERGHVRNFLHKTCVTLQSRKTTAKKCTKKVCCTCKVAFLLIRPIVIFHRSPALPSPLSITRFYILFEQTITIIQSFAFNPA